MAPLTLGDLPPDIRSIAKDHLAKHPEPISFYDLPNLVTPEGSYFWSLVLKGNWSFARQELSKVMKARLDAEPYIEMPMMSPLERDLLEYDLITRDTVPPDNKYAKKMKYEFDEESLEQFAREVWKAAINRPDCFEGAPDQAGFSPAFNKLKESIGK